MMNASDSRDHRIAVVGVGGAGCNAVSDFYNGHYAVDTIAINTDKEGLKRTSADRKLYICKGVLHGEGAKGDSAVGKTCADAHLEEIRDALSGYDMVFVVSGLGAGTGTGATPAVIDAAQSQNILTFAISIMPFFLEGRSDIAKEGYSRIRGICPHAMAIHNDAILTNTPNLSVPEAFHKVNETIMEYVSACSEAYSGCIESKMHDDDGFDSFIKGTPLYAYTSA